MMHLRDIENAYGPGSLRVLASLTGLDEDAMSIRDYLDYFKYADTEKREKLAEILLDQKIERKAYDNHREIISRTDN